MSILIDFPSYLTGPRLSAASSVVLVRRMINAAPKDLTEREKAALKLMRMGAVRVQTIEKARDRARPENLTPQDRRFDGYWGMLRDQAAAWLRVEGEPKYKLAEDLLLRIFPNGITFVTASYEEEWFESKTRLERIDEDGLEETINELVHPDILPQVRAAHVALGEGLGVGETYVAPPDGEAMRSALRELSDAIGNYARILAGAVDIDDQESAARFLAAVGPIDRHRAEYPSGEMPPDPSAPQPPAPPITDPGEPGPDEPLPVIE